MDLVDKIQFIIDSHSYNDKSKSDSFQHHMIDGGKLLISVDYRTNRLVIEKVPAEDIVSIQRKIN